MPELPEVECLTRAVSANLSGATLVTARFLRKDLRDPIPVREFKRALEGQVVGRFWRRSKYMIWQADQQSGVFHLGMTGNMRLFATPKPVLPHTHAVFTFATAAGDDIYLHYIDPRRFGRIGCLPNSSIDDHPWFKSLGPEPLDCRKLGAHLFARSRLKRQAVKTFLMDPRVVVGVGNIYASESLFRAGINPTRAAHEVSEPEYQQLAKHVRTTLKDAIKAGGTTLRNFRSTDGQSGYFSIKLNVYDRQGEPCRSCDSPIVAVRQTGRSTFYCGTCQS